MLKAKECHVVGPGICAGLMQRYHAVEYEICDGLLEP